MALVKVSTKGDFSQTYLLLNRGAKVKKSILKKLNKYGEQGVEALSKATPKLTGKTAASWRYVINEEKNKLSISWVNDNMTEGKYQVPVVLLIQYGHATKSGVFVEGVDFISPTMVPIFAQMAEDIWSEVIVGE
jgi:hypothetical protein